MELPTNQKSEEPRPTSQHDEPQPTSQHDEPQPTSQYAEESEEAQQLPQYGETVPSLMAGQTEEDRLTWQALGLEMKAIDFFGAMSAPEKQLMEFCPVYRASDYELTHYPAWLISRLNDINHETLSDFGYCLRCLRDGTSDFQEVVQFMAAKKASTDKLMVIVNWRVEKAQTGIHFDGFEEAFMARQQEDATAELPPATQEPQPALLSERKFGPRPRRGLPQPPPKKIERKSAPVSTGLSRRPISPVRRCPGPDNLGKTRYIKKETNISRKSIPSSVAPKSFLVALNCLYEQSIISPAHARALALLQEWNITRSMTAQEMYQFVNSETIDNLKDEEMYIFLIVVGFFKMVNIHREKNLF